MPVANARMYSVTPAVKSAWHDVLRHALSEAGLSWPVIDHDAPAPLAALWARADLGCAMMCGVPYSRRSPRPTLIAAPVPSPERYGGRPVYFTDIAVRADSAYSTLEDTFGGVIGYTLEDSMSGYVALRSHLASLRGGPRPLYRKAVGGFLNARAIIEALERGEIDAGPLDSYYFDLLRRNDPAFAAKVRIVATTPAAPIPPLVATTPLEPRDLDRLRAALLRVTDVPSLLLKGFAIPDARDYDVLERFVAASNRAAGIW
jgi:ABC-type phosphate/phosphonate transport system substrate-binding protein